MAQILTHPNAIAAENLTASMSVAETFAYEVALRNAEALALEWAVTFNDAWRSGQLIFSDDGAKVMNQFTQLMGKTMRMMGE